MSGEDAIPRIQQRLQARIVVSIETPVRMVDQLFITLVGRIDGQEESFGIAGVNEDGNAQASAFFPHGIQTRIVDREQFAILVANAQAEIFEQLQAASSARDRIAKQG